MTPEEYEAAFYNPNGNSIMDFDDDENGIPVIDTRPVADDPDERRSDIRTQDFYDQLDSLDD